VWNLGAMDDELRPCQRSSLVNSVTEKSAARDACLFSFFADDTDA
jgi:hypothetical protein